VIAIPAVDLRDGACVQLVGGAFDDERVRLPNPLDAVARWADAGFQRLHVVDLDAAADVGSNDTIIDDIIRTAETRVAVGGGVRTDDRVARLLSTGADTVVVGTRALEEPEWLESITARYPRRIVLAADVRDRTVVTRAWRQKLALTLSELAARLAPLPLAGVLVTAVHREGRLQGPDLDLVDEAVRSIPHPVIASGGITTRDDLRALETRGAAACVIGMALYSGALDARAVAEEFNT
jgi:phosphoribosylformimino-5-aminoimidazole carboxamide ribotide isomerase